jgi:sugar phosphate isomerase/epimerase
MYRRSVITDEISQDLREVLEVAQALSLAGLEIRSIGGRRVDQLDWAAARQIRSAVEDAGMAVCAVAPPFYKCDVDSSTERQEHLDILRRTIDVGHELGTNLVRTFTFWRTRALDEVWDRIVDAYDQPIEIARQGEAILAVENEHSCMIGTGSELARFLDAVADDRVRALWDPCNALYAAADEEPFPVGYDAIRGRLVHVHLKDALRRPDDENARLTPLGEGTVRVSEQLRALVHDGYTGYVSLETHWRPDVLDEQTMRLPGGHAFSEKAAGATIYCLKKWDAMFNEADR